MKTILVTLLVGLYAHTCSTVSPRHASRASVEQVVDNVVDSVNFAKQIQPILQKNCSPCHFPGGKMYERMPFDAGKTIVSHKDGILRRIKEEKENTLIKTYIEQHTSAD